MVFSSETPRGGTLFGTPEAMPSLFYSPNKSKNQIEHALQNLNQTCPEILFPHSSTVLADQPDASTFCTHR
jgi:hypothetical protein